jgi:hypothetical protein
MCDGDRARGRAAAISASSVAAVRRRFVSSPDRGATVAIAPGVVVTGTPGIIDDPGAKRRAAADRTRGGAKGVSQTVRGRILGRQSAHGKSPCLDVPLLQPFGRRIERTDVYAEQL